MRRVLRSDGSGGSPYARATIGSPWTPPDPPEQEPVLLLDNDWWDTLETAPADDVPGGGPTPYAYVEDWNVGNEPVGPGSPTSVQIAYFWIRDDTEEKYFSGEDFENYFEWYGEGMRIVTPGMYRLTWRALVSSSAYHPCWVYVIAHNRTTDDWARITPMAAVGPANELTENPSLWYERFVWGAETCYLPWPHLLSPQPEPDDEVLLRLVIESQPYGTKGVSTMHQALGAEYLGPGTFVGGQ